MTKILLFSMEKIELKLPFEDGQKNSAEENELTLNQLQANPYLN